MKQPSRHWTGLVAGCAIALCAAQEAAAWTALTATVSETLLAQNQRQRRGQAEPAGDREDLSSPTNPNRPIVRDAEPGTFWADFDESTLKEVVEAIGPRTGKNFFIDPAVGPQNVTIVSHHPVPDELAFEILEAILDAYGLAMFPTLDGNLIRIANRGTGPDKLDISVSGEDDIEGFDRFIIRIEPVKHTDATEVSELLQAVGSQNGQIRVYARTNTLVLIDTANGIRNMLEVLQLVDVPGFEVEQRIFELKYSRAEIMASQLIEVLQDDGDGAPRPAAQPQTAARIRAARAQAAGGGGAETAIVGGGDQVLRIVPDERLNSLIVVASIPMMQQVEFFIERLDVATPFEANNMHYVELLYADAEGVQEALDALVSATSPRSSATGAQEEAEIKPFERNVFITTYEQNNALLVVASPQDFGVLREMIDNLDRPRKQVNVQAIILGVTITDQFEWSVEAAGLDQSDFFALSNVADIANALVSPIDLAGAGGVLGIIDDTSTITFTDPITGGQVTQEVPNVPLLLQAVEGLTDAEVLSQPNILTQDNSESSLIVGQEVPILNSLSDVDDRTGFQSRGSISREDVGVQLTVTPQINEGDTVRLEINVEVSDTVDSAVGVDPNELGPTFQKSQFTNEVVIRDTQTGIIGGLIRENKSRVRNQTPLLGDLPVLGWMFRSKRNSRNKQNLVVMVSPRIIRELDDLGEITDERLAEFYEFNKDVILEDLGFIREQRKKNWKRDKYSPIGQYDENADPDVLVFPPDQPKPDNDVIEPQNDAREESQPKKSTNNFAGDRDER